MCESLRRRPAIAERGYKGMGEVARALKICIHKWIQHRRETDNAIQQRNNMRAPVDQDYEANIEYQIKQNSKCDNKYFQ